MDQDSKLEYLIDACGYGLQERAMKLVEEGANVNGHHNGYTPLIASIVGQNLELTSFLIQSGANLNPPGHTALHEAFDCILANMMEEGLDQPDAEEMDMIALLITAGADPDLKNDSGERPLDYLNQYALGRAHFEKLKDFFRHLIPDIDGRISYAERDDR